MPIAANFWNIFNGRYGCFESISKGWVSFAEYNCLRYPDRQKLWRKLEIMSLAAYFAVAVKRVLERDTKGRRSFIRTVGASSR